MEEEEEEAAWKSLDLDDSDISSSFSLLHRSNRLPTPQPRRIPGPAAAIQAAMNRHTLTDRNAELVEISTQEYIRRVHQDSDLDFSRHPWLFAIHSLGCDAAFNPTCLKDIIINTCFNPQRIHKVVAVIKSCTPNGLGHMILTLKDPTDTIAATVHQKVLGAADFGKFITAGSILILQKVVAFPSTFESCYLNITRRNVVKVISVNCEVQYFPDKNLGSAQEKNSDILENTSLVSRRTRRLSEDVQLSYNVNDNTTIQASKEGENCTQARGLSSNKHVESSSYKISKEPILNNLVDSGHKTLGSLGKWQVNSCRVARPGPEIGVSANCLALARDVSSAPSMIENYGNRHAWQQSGPELERLFKGNTCTTTMRSMTGKCHNSLQNPDFRSSSAVENLNELDCSPPNDAQKHGLRMDIKSGPSLVENLAGREIAKPNDGKQWMHLEDTQPSVDLTQNDSETTGSGGIKKQKVGLISKTSVQEWTDEQLCVLEMDED